jgi:ribosomal protein S18 acetylase RimI-like enzyme
MASYSFRLATPEDAPALATAAAAFFIDTFGASNSADDMQAYLDHAFSESRQRAELEAPDARIWVAIAAEGDIAGYVHVRESAPLPPRVAVESERPAEIVRLYADRRWHGQGLGRSLMNVGVETARAWAADVLWLGVWERNTRAIAFYGKEGFSVVGEQQFLLGADRQRDLVMARRLTSKR